MYREIMAHLRDEIVALEKQILTKQKAIGARKIAYENIINFQAEVDKRDGKLAVQKGVCPFPDLCNFRKYCVNDTCDVDELSSDGYPRKGILKERD